MSDPKCGRHASLCHSATVLLALFSSAPISRLASFEMGGRLRRTRQRGQMSSVSRLFGTFQSLALTLPQPGEPPELDRKRALFARFWSHVPINFRTLTRQVGSDHIFPRLRSHFQSWSQEPARPGQKLLGSVRKLNQFSAFPGMESPSTDPGA